MTFCTLIIESDSLASSSECYCMQNAACMSAHCYIFTAQCQYIVGNELHESCKPWQVDVWLQQLCMVDVACVWWWGPMWYLFMGPKIPGHAPAHSSVLQRDICCLYSVFILRIFAFSHMPFSQQTCVTVGKVQVSLITLTVPLLLFRCPSKAMTVWKCSVLKVNV